MNDPILLKVDEARNLLGIGRSKIYEMIGSGDIPTVKIGSLTRIPRNGLMAYVEKLTGESQSDKVLHLPTAR